MLDFLKIWLDYLGYLSERIKSTKNAKNVKYAQDTNIFIGETPQNSSS